MEFVALDEIDPMFFDRPYYLEPEKKGARAYALLREALKATNQVGIAKVVIKTRQHLAAVKPEQDALVLELMHFAEELIPANSLQIPGRLDLGKKELDMATELVDRMSDHWHPDKYEDEYRHALLELIQKKIESGGELPDAKAPSKRAAGKVIDLVSVLQESLQRAEKSGRKTGKPARRQGRALNKAA
jgi:DNA end-binding protein Ku